MWLLSNGIKLAIALLVVIWASLPEAHAQVQKEPFVTKAPQVLLIDHDSGTVLLAKNPDKNIAPASLAKLMTAELVFHALKENRIRLDTTYTVSEYAWRTGGAPSRTSTMFAALKSSISVEDLLQGMIVQAANDGAIILAEGLAGNEQSFVEMMNNRAVELGLSNSRFVNSTGLPAPEQTVTLSDLLRLAQHIYTTYPEFYKFYSQPNFTWNKIFQRNRNPLLALDIGADGLATGYTEDSGYALVGSAAKNGRRLFLAMSGLATIKEREEEAKKLVDWGMSAFDEVQIFSAEDIVGDAEVFGGSQATVPLKVENEVSLLLPKDGREKLKASLIYEGPLQAPFAAGIRVGTVQFELDGAIVRELPVVTARAVQEGTLSQKARSAALELATGWMRKYL
ncbi:D-alanyl-D-alanine carboxypeptidase family protein [Falsochrobactrum ovis]|uniref:serine-type D-Ala-D-Ala carboxypeptidase n=1 Tax=Falsochrobactrum ovis TaxID=1293442 RepID=A0A364JU14_9HYPH|nr:D-alanyl-D-alanine carboxypeptidase family protein [Falsochrobactrum ovis]RAK27600.1 D-alanyl-D-alanine carboxypeptidase (penicillin-binding protein 5/6) [Falsochrobactrum ovis]